MPEASAMDWDEIRKLRFSDMRPNDWPAGVSAIANDGLALLGVHESDNRLYWDGKEVVTKNIVRLGALESWLALLATASVIGGFVLQLGHSAGWWH